MAIMRSVSPPLSPSQFFITDDCKMVEYKRPSSVRSLRRKKSLKQLTGWNN